MTTRQQQIEKLKQTLLNIQSGLSNVSKQLEPFVKAEKAGMRITPKTTTEEVQKYNAALPKTTEVKMPSAGINKETSYRDWMFKTLQQQNKYLQDYINTLKNQPSPLEVYKQYSEQLGLPQQRKQLTGIQKQVIDTEALLDKLEDDINKRISGKLVTEAQRRRYLAMEGKPLREQLADLMRAESRARAGYSEARRELADMLKIYGQEQARKRELAALPLEYGYKNIPYYKEIFTYESPEEKAKRELAEKLALKKAGEKEPEAYRLWKLTGSKLNFGDWYKNIYKGREEKEEIKPFWTKIDYKKLSALGIPRNIADTISVALQEGLSLEAIRRALAEEYGREKGYHYLDIIMPYIQKQKKNYNENEIWQ